MDIPRHWAEHREQRTLAGRRSVTLHRFGWSSESQDAAQRHAEQRVAEAWTQWDAGRKPTRREAKVAYGGADGLPIREEIVAEDTAAGAVVTRNAYGARCLNVSDILFADVDLGEAGALMRELRKHCIGLAVLLGLLFCCLLVAGDRAYVGSGALLLLIVPVGWRVATEWRAWRRAANPQRVLVPLRRWCVEHPAWLVRIYRTPAGLRLLATHAACDPRGAETEAFFTCVDGDPLYRVMCQKQACFRARVSAKPWRIGIKPRMGWGTWPVVKEPAVQRRSAWIADYEAKARGFRACAFLAEIGSGTESARGRAVRELHDELCQIQRELPLA